MTTWIFPKGVNIQNIALIQLNRKDFPQYDDKKLPTGTWIATQNSLGLASTAKDVKICLSYDAALEIKTVWKRCQLVINDTHEKSLIKTIPMDDQLLWKRTQDHTIIISLPCVCYVMLKANRWLLKYIIMAYSVIRFHFSNGAHLLNRCWK